MTDRKLEGLVRLIDKRKAGDRVSAETMIELGEVSDPSGSAGAVPTCTVDGDDAEVFEPYGLAGQAVGGDALVFAPGGDSDNLTALVSSVAGRPATEPGDKALWTAAGHVIYLDDDGGITITARSLSDVTVIVDDGQVVNVGDALAAVLLKAQASQNHLVAAATYAAQNFAPNDGGVLAFTNFAAFLDGSAIIPPAIPGNDLVNAAATTKAKGT
jgi:hypothetical protein